MLVQRRQNVEEPRVGARVIRHRCRRLHPRLRSAQLEHITISMTALPSALGANAKRMRDSRRLLVRVNERLLSDKGVLASVMGWRKIGWTTVAPSRVGPDTESSNLR